MFEGIHHVAIIVADLDEARVFWGGTVGLPELDRPDFGVPGVWYGIGAGQQLHIAAFDDHEAPKRQHFALQVADLDAVIERLEQGGVSVRRAREVAGAGRQAAFTDPAGNRVELNQPVE